MNSFFQSVSSIFVVLICSVVLGMSGCDNPGSVGSELGGSESEVVSDTLFIDSVQAIEPNSYSGELSYFSAGQYEDPLFGSMTATGFLKPNLPASSDTVEANAKMLMRVLFDGSQVYGDSTAGQEFTIYEIDELWRDRALKIHDDIQINTNAQVGSFTVGDKDSIDVELSSEWLGKYRQYADTSNADSLYKYDLFGLALVPEDGGKIIPLKRSNTRFVIQNPEADSFEVALNQWGYNLQRGTENAIPSGSVPLYSTYESVINFGDLGISKLNIQPSGLSRAMLVLSQNNPVMEQSLESEPSTVKRPEETTAYLHFADPTQVPDNIDPGVPTDNVFKIGGLYSSEDGTYRFDITSLVENILRNGFPEGREFFITFPNDGVIKPSLIYSNSDQAPKDKQPKIIITSLKNSSQR